MSEHKHTPGPWAIDDPEGFALKPGEEDAGWSDLCIKGPNGEYVLSGCGCCGSPNVEKKADAHLMAAAPELLHALEGLLTLHENVDFESDADWDAARAAIAKATGH